MAHGEFVGLMVQLGTMLATGTLLGRLARRLRAPAVVGELAAGIVLGPSVLGVLAPRFEAALFPTVGPTHAARHLVAQLGLLAFVFLAGLDLDFRTLRTRRSTLVWTAGLGIALPFASGALLALNLRPDPALSSAAPWALMLFLGTALSISALPVIARILFDLGLQGSKLATLVLASASIDDWIGWSLFGVVAGMAGSSTTSSHPAAALFAGLTLTAAALLVARPLVRRLRPWLHRRLGGHASQLAAAAATCLIAGATAEALGTHALFGVFLVATTFSQGPEIREPVRDALEPFVVGVLAPLYFVNVGLGVNLAEHFQLGLTIVVLAAATIGKLVGAGGGAWLGGLPASQALAVGVALNARGAMEIVLGTAARDCGLIGDGLFVTLVTVAVVTSLAAGPVLARLVPGSFAVAASAKEPSHDARDMEGAAAPREPGNGSLRSFMVTLKNS